MVYKKIDFSRPIVLIIVSKSSQRRSLVAIAMPTPLVTSSVAAPAMSLNTHFAVQSATADTSTSLFSKSRQDRIPAKPLHKRPRTSLASSALSTFPSIPSLASSSSDAQLMRRADARNPLAQLSPLTSLSPVAPFLSCYHLFLQPLESYRHSLVGSRYRGI